MELGNEPFVVEEKGVFAPDVDEVMEESDSSTSVLADLLGIVEIS
jgi:hypothetical protein